MAINRDITVTPSDLGAGQHKLSWTVKDEDDATTVASGDSTFASTGSPHDAMAAVMLDIEAAVAGQETVEMLPATFSFAVPKLPVARGLDIYELLDADITMTDKGDGNHNVAYSIKNQVPTEVATGNTDYANTVVGETAMNAVRIAARAYQRASKAVTDIPTPTTIYFTPEERSQSVTLDPPYTVTLTRSDLGAGQERLAYVVADNSGTVASGNYDTADTTKAGVAVAAILEIAKTAVTDSYTVADMGASFTLPYEPPDYVTGLLTRPYTIEVAVAFLDPTYQVTSVVKDGTPATLDTDVTVYAAATTAGAVLRATRAFARTTVMAEDTVSDMSEQTAVKAAHVPVTDKEALDVSLKVQNTESFARTAEHVTFGVPFSNDFGLLNVDRLRVIDSNGDQVDAQFAITSRYGGVAGTDPVRWALMDFQPTVGGSTSAYYRIREGQPQEVTTPITVDDAASITVTTDNLAVVFPKSGDGFISSVKRSETELLTGRVNCTVTHVANGPFTCDVSSASVEVETDMRVVIKSYGTWKDAVSANWVGGDGRKDVAGDPGANGQNIDWTMRATFFHGKDFFRLDFRLEGDGPDAQYSGVGMGHFYFDSMIMDIPYDLGTVSKLVFPNYTETVDPTGDWVLDQQHSIVTPNDEADNFSYTLKQGVSTEDSGVRTDGWCFVSDGTDALMLAQRYFWEQYPAILEVDVTNDDINLHLFPDTADPETGDYGSGNYWIAGGTNKTYECFIGVSTDAGIDSDIAKRVVAVPLIALPTPEYYCDSGAWTRTAVGGFHSTIGAGSGDLWESFERMEELFQLVVDPTEGDSGDQTMATQRETRADAASRGSSVLDLYGWDLFGCMWWRNIKHNGAHYGWSGLSLQHLLRTGDIRWWEEVAYPMCLHHHELDYSHSTATGPGVGYVGRGHQWWEEDVHEIFDSTPNRNHHFNDGLLSADGGSHYWNDGSCLFYTLTGRSPFKEQAIEVYGITKDIWWGKRDIDTTPYIRAIQASGYSAREEGWTIQQRINLHRITGDTTYLNEAKLLVTDSLDSNEQQLNADWDTNYGSNDLSGAGWHLTHNASHPGPYATITMQSYNISPMLELCTELGYAGIDATDVEDALKRKMDWFINKNLFGGRTRPADGYMNAHGPAYNWNPATEAIYDDEAYGSIAMPHDSHLAAGFLGAYLLLKDNDRTTADLYLDKARRLFKEHMFYRELSGFGYKSTDYFDPAVKGPVRWTYPDTFSREWGWIGRSANHVMAIERDLNIGRI